MRKKICICILSASLILLYVLTAIINVGAVATIPESLSSDSNNEFIEFYQGADTATSMSEEDVISAHFSIAADALFIGVGCTSWGDNVGNITINLYRFVSDYETSVAGEPIATYIFESFTHNNILGIRFLPNAPLEAGEYVIMLSDAFDPDGSGVGVWKHSAYPGQVIYENDTLVENESIRLIVKFLQSPEGNPYGSLTGFTAGEDVLTTPEIPIKTPSVTPTSEPNIDSSPTNSDNPTVIPEIEDSEGCGKSCAIVQIMFSIGILLIIKKKI